ncbi:MAG: ABC transporter ATP-binding protein [Parvularculaceae bacterium]
MTFVLRYWARLPVTMSAAFALMFVATVADLMLPWASGRLIDVLADDSAGRDAARAYSALGLFLGLAGFYFFMRNIAFRLWVVAAARNMSALITDAFARVQKFSADWHANSFAGATVRKITRGMWAYDTVSDAIFIGILPSALVILGLSLQMAMRWPVAGGVMLAMAILFVVLSMTLSLKYVSPANAEQNEADSRLGAAIADALTNNASVKAFGSEPREERRFADIARIWRAKAMRAWPRFMDMALAQNMLLVVMQGVLIFIAVQRWTQGTASAGDVTFVLTSFFIIAGYLRSLGETLQQLQRGVNELDDVVKFANEPIGVSDRPCAKEFHSGDGEIRFENVTFGYANQTKPLYEGFSLRIAPGERVALVGPSGSGKSTFIRLVQRLYDVDNGRILIDGQDVAAVTQTSLRSAIALVPQDPALFHRSLAENIAYGRPDATQDEIEAAARRARAHEFIAKLPEGYGTLVGERGVKLSGGERQRVAIARAFLADAPILILDEATSSLDSITEAQIQEAIADLMCDRTAIVVAHRLSTIRNADRILVFDRGTIVEEGGHAELLARPSGKYRALHAIQGAA